MSDAMQDALQRAIFALPFFVTDAWLERMFNLFDLPQLQPGKITTKRRQLSTGSVQIDILAAQKRIGWFVLMGVSEKNTLFEVYAARPAMQEIMELLFNRFRRDLNDVILLAFEGDTQVQSFLTQINNNTEAVSNSLPAADSKEPQRKSREPPKSDDPIDDWLDWRERELAHGRSTRDVSFSKLAEQSKHSLSQFKHRSAERSRTKAEP